MISLSQSAFLQALGWAIANSLWQMALLWGMYQLCFSVYRQATASVKTNVATAALFGGFLWFLSSLTSHYWQVKETLAHPVLVYVTDSTAPPAQGQSLQYWINLGLGEIGLYLPYLSFAYLLVLTFLLLRVVKAYQHVQQIRHEGLLKMEAKWRVYVTELAHRIGITKEVKVWLSEKIDIPATIGYIKPLVLIPVASFNHLTSEQVEAILLHELAHIKRNDYLLNLLTTVVETVLFFNPFAQLITRHIKTERENSCDDFVLQFRFNPHEYASALLSLEQQRRIPELAMMAAGKTDLLDRIKRIMNVQTKPMNYGQKLIALFITAGILGSLAWLTPGPERPENAVTIAATPPKVQPDFPEVRPSLARETSEARSVATPSVKVTVDTRPTCQASHKQNELRPDQIKVDRIMVSDDFAAPIPTPKVPAEVTLVPGSDWGADPTDEAITLETDVRLSESAIKLKKKFIALQQKKDRDAEATADLQQAFVKAAAAIDGQLDQIKVLHIVGQPSHKVLDSTNKLIIKLMHDKNVFVKGRKELDRHSPYDRSTVSINGKRDVFLIRNLSLVIKKDVEARTGQIQSDEEDTGIDADQPGWKKTEEDMGDMSTPRAGASAIPTAYFYPRVTVRPDYKERITVPNTRSSSIGGFLAKLSRYGITPKDQVLRIVKDGNTLLINDQVQSRDVYSLFNAYFRNESLVIIANGQVVQVTIN